MSKPIEMDSKKFISQSENDEITASKQLKEKTDTDSGIEWKPVIDNNSDKVKGKTIFL